MEKPEIRASAALRRYDKHRNEVTALKDDRPDLDAPLESAKPAARDLPPAALKALKEAEARGAKTQPVAPRELNGRSGLDPLRYGDWEVKGIVSDF